MIRKTALALAFSVAMTGTAFAQANIVGTYTYSGTDTDGSKYPESGSLVISAEKSGAYQVKWDGGEYIGVGQITGGNILAVAAVAENRNTIMLMEIGADGTLSGKWWRREDAGSKGTEVWKKK